MGAKDRPLAFIDTHILLYAHDQNGGEKQKQAAALLTQLWQERRGTLSPQVLQEFLVNTLRKLSNPLALAQARDIVRTYGLWVKHDASVAHILRATKIMALTQYSFWDSQIIASAEAAGAEILYSEDMQHDRQIAGITIVNPFTVQAQTKASKAP